jgi:hypothetical protein
VSSKAFLDCQGPVGVASARAREHFNAAAPARYPYSTGGGLNSSLSFL